MKVNRTILHASLFRSAAIFADLRKLAKEQRKCEKKTKEIKSRDLEEKSLPIKEVCDSSFGAQELWLPTLKGVSWGRFRIM